MSRKVRVGLARKQRYNDAVDWKVVSYAFTHEGLEAINFCIDSTLYV